MIQDAELALVWIAGALLAAGAIAAVVRIVRGPSLMDRMIASDVLLTTIVLAVGAEMLINEHNDNVLLMIAITAVAAFATVAVVRTVSKHDRTSGAMLPPQSSSNAEDAVTGSRHVVRGRDMPGRDRPGQGSAS